MSRLQVPNRMLLNPIPAGGTTGQVLSKGSGTDYAYVWSPPGLSQAAGDLRYDALGAASSGDAAHVAAADPHAIYLTQTEGDGRYLQPSAAAAAYVPLAGGSVMTGLLGPTTTNTRDLGTTTVRWRDAYLSRDVYVPGAVKFGSGGAALSGSGTDVYVANNLNVFAGVSTFADMGADVPGVKAQGMVAIGGRINIGGLGGVDRMAYIGIGVNTPPTSLMNGSNQTLMYAEYWGNDAATGNIVGMDFGVIGPPSVKPAAITLFRLRGIGARTQLPNDAIGLKVESINNGVNWNIGVDISAPGTSASNQWGLINRGTTWQFGQVDFGSPARGSIFTVEGGQPAVNFVGYNERTIFGGMYADLISNAYWAGAASWGRMTNGQPVGLLELASGTLAFYSAPAATGAPAFVQMMGIDTAGSLSVAGNVLAGTNVFARSGVVYLGAAGAELGIQKGYSDGLQVNANAISMYGDTPWIRSAAASSYVPGQFGVNGVNINANGVLFSAHSNVYGGIFYSTTGQFLAWPSEGRFKAQQAALPDPLRLLDRAAISYRQPSVEWVDGHARLAADEAGGIRWGFRAEDWRDIPELVGDPMDGIDSFALSNMIPLTWEAVRAIYAELVTLRLRVEELEKV